MVNINSWDLIFYHNKTKTTKNPKSVILDKKELEEIQKNIIENEKKIKAETNTECTNIIKAFDKMLEIQIKKKINNENFKFHNIGEKIKTNNIIMTNDIKYECDFDIRKMEKKINKKINRKTTIGITRYENTKEVEPYILID